jgi:hypothetical protein
MAKLPDPARAIRDGQHILELLIACWQGTYSLSFLIFLAAALK